MHYQVGRNSRGWLGWWERCMKNRPVHLCESFGNMGAEVIPSEAEMSFVQSQESYVFREPVSISEEVVYVGAHKFDHGNGCMLIMGMTSGSGSSSPLLPCIGIQNSRNQALSSCLSHTP